jgi:hypothetical protein
MPRNPTDAIERAVTVQFVGRAEPIAPAELYAAVPETPTAIDAAVDALVNARVLLRAAHGQLQASKTLAKLDALKLIDV